MADQDVNIREIDFYNLVVAAEGEEFFRPPEAYNFSGRSFKDKGIDSRLYSGYYDNQVVDGDFTGDGSAWISQVSFTGYGTGQIVTTSTGTCSTLQTLSSTPVAGTEYESHIIINKLDATSMRLYFSNARRADGTNVDYTEPGEYRERIWTVSGASAAIYVYGSDGAGSVIIDEWSVQRV